MVEQKNLYELKPLPTERLKKIYNEETDTDYDSSTISYAAEVLKERGEISTEEANEKQSTADINFDEIGDTTSTTNTTNTTGAINTGKSEWEHKIVTGDVLSGSNTLEATLESLGKSGWELVDTQRHSIMGKQKAICFLKKRVKNKTNDQLNEIEDKLAKLLEVFDKEKTEQDNEQGE